MRILLSLASFLFLNKITCQEKVPLIGVVTIVSSLNMRVLLPDANKNWNYVAKSYIEYINHAGGVAVFLPHDASEQHFQNLLNSVDMVLLTGGSENLFEHGKPDSYLQKVNQIIKHASKLGDEGRHFPVLGICLGFQSLGVALAGNKIILTPVPEGLSGVQQILKTFGFSRSKFWSRYDSDLVNEVLRDAHLTFSLGTGITPASFNKNVYLKENILVTSTVKASKDITLVASYEHVQYPIYGVQFHPEKTIYEKKTPAKISRHPKAIKFTSDLILKLIDTVRESARKMEDVSPMVKGYFDMYHRPRVTSWSDFEQIYVFQAIY